MTAESARDIAAGRVSAEAAVLGALERLDRWEPLTNAFSQVFGEEVHEEAKRPREGVLAGVPVAVKDLFDVAGRETTGCSAAYRGNVATGDAAVVTALRSADAVVIGKTNMHELAFGTTNLVSACGPAHNPWDLERVPGGSSGGSGAAVASRVVPIALGTDTGGSIRIPSSFCGVFGLKPTHGRLSLDGVMPLAASLDCPGPMAWSAGDLALAWLALAGEEPASASPARVAVMRTDRATDAVLEGVDAVAAAFGALGASRSDIPDGLAGTGDAWLEVAAPEFLAAHPKLLEQRDEVHPFIGAFLEFGRTLSPEQAEDGRRRQAQSRAWFDEQLRDAEILVMPATPFPAPRADDEFITVRSGDAIDVHLGGASTFTRAVNLAGLPSLALPAGRSPEGMPIGVQMVGRRGSEALLLWAALALEALDPRFASAEPPAPASA